MLCVTPSAVSLPSVTETKFPITQIIHLVDVFRLCNSRHHQATIRVSLTGLIVSNIITRLIVKNCNIIVDVSSNFYQLICVMMANVVLANRKSW